MTKRVLIGMLTPSSNTVLEPVTTAMLAGLPEVSVHFSRFRVTEIALSAGALAQFDDATISAAAELLADAKVDVIGWNGTSAGWLGFESDIRLCERITALTGIAATTSMLALNDVLRARAITRLGMVTPYLDDVQARIIANYRALGIECVWRNGILGCVTISRFAKSARSRSPMPCARWPSSGRRRLPPSAPICAPPRW